MTCSSPDAFSTGAPLSHLANATCCNGKPPGGYAEIRADTVHGEIVGIRTLAIYAELSLVVESRGGHDHTRRKQDQCLEAPAIQRNIVCKRTVNHRADRRGLRRLRIQ